MPRLIQIALLASLLALAFSLNSCNALALTGAKKYKVDLSNILLALKADIENNGEVSDKNLSKLEGFLAKHREEFSTKGSFMRASEALTEIRTARDEYAAGRNGFMNYQAAKQLIFQTQDMLKTEVKDD